MRQPDYKQTGYRGGDFGEFTGFFLDRADKAVQTGEGELRLLVQDVSFS